MRSNSSAFASTRRGFLGAAALMLAAPKAFACGGEEIATSIPIDPSRLDYRDSLVARLDDAGGGDFDGGYAEALLTEANKFRDRLALAPYAWDEGLAAAARAHAADMARRDYFGHVSPEGFNHLDRVSLLTRDLCGRTCENLLWRANDPYQSPATFQRMWEDSPGHRKNLMRPEFNSAGYGVVKVGSKYYAAGVYSEVTLRLSKPLPLEVGRDEIAESLDAVSPSCSRFALTRPFIKPTSSLGCGEKLPVLEPGAWQLRPLVRKETFYEVLPGPTFFVS